MAKFNVEIVDKGAGSFNTFVKELRGFQEILSEFRGSVEAGFLEGQSDPDSVMKSTKSELGYNGTPRPHVGPALDKRKDDLIAVLSTLPESKGKLTKTWIKNAKSAMFSHAAQMLADQIRTNIIELKSPANRPATVARKGFDDPLIETGDMRDDVAWRVRDGDGRIVAGGKAGPGQSKLT